MNTEHYHWLLTQIPKLEEKKIIDSQSAQNLDMYCRKLITSADKPKPIIPGQTKQKESQTAINRKEVNWVPVILMVTSSILVVGGIISLIAYNWAFISRTAKTVAALVLLLGIQAAVLTCTLKGKMEKLAVRESVGIAWALLFGAVIAFISQILRLPSNTSAFIAVWAASSILVLYSTKSQLVFYLSLILGIAYISATKYYNDSSSLIYVLFAALIPYALTHKSQHLKWSLLCYAVCILGFCLDKTVPGLWIVAYSSLLAVFAMSKDKTLRVIFSSALTFLLVLLCWNSFWKDIGWNFIRTSPGHHIDGFILDIVLTASLFITCMALVVYRNFIKKEKDRINLIALIPLVITILYLAYSAFCIKTSAPASATLILMSFIITAVLSLWQKNKLFVVGLFVTWIQLVLSLFYLPFAAFFCCFIYTLSLISVRVRHLNIRYKPIVFTLYRIVLFFIYFILTFALIGNGVKTQLQAEHYTFITLYSLVVIMALAAFAFTLGKSGFASIFDLILFPLCGFILSVIHTITPAPFLSHLNDVILLLMSLLGFWSLQIKKKGRMSPYVFVLLILISTTGRTPLLEDVFVLVTSLMAWCMALYSIYGNKPMGITSIIASSISLALTGYNITGFTCIFQGKTMLTRDAFIIIISFVIFLASAILALKKIIKERKWFNPIFFIHPLLVFVIIMIPGLCTGGVEKAMHSVCFALLALFCIYYLVKASVHPSLATANLAAVFLGLAVMIKFFAEDYSLVAKGLLFIALGIGVFLINIFLSRRRKNEK